MGAFALIVLLILGLVLIGPVLQLIAGLSLAIILPLLFAMLAGIFAGRLIRGRGYGPGGNILLGIAGWLVGHFVLGLIGLGGISGLPLVGGILVSVIGAVVLVWLLRLLGNRDFAA
jgi:uncharacterized membrane protein YeaQ/YmgE (transglycosylase-associated protein family)